MYWGKGGALQKRPMATLHHTEWDRTHSRRFFWVLFSIRKALWGLVEGIWAGEGSF